METDQRSVGRVFCDDILYYDNDFIGMAANRLDYKVHSKLQKKKK